MLEKYSVLPWRIANGVVALAIISVLFASLPGAAFAASASVIRNYKTGTCLYPESTSQGALIRSTGCAGSDEQLWSVDAAGRIVNSKSKQCLDLLTVSTGNGVQLAQRACSNAASQKWVHGVVFYAYSSGNGVYVGNIGKSALPYALIKNGHSGKCMDQPVDGNPAQQWDCGASSNDNQKWFFAE